MAGMSWSNSGTARFKLDRDCATMAGPNTHHNELSWTKRELDDREGIHRKNFCGEPRVDHFQPKVLAGIRIESPGPGKYGRKDPLVDVQVHDFRSWLRKEKREKRKGELGKSGVLDKGRAESAQFAGSICESKRFFYPVLKNAHESPLGKYKAESTFEFKPKKTCKKKPSNFNTEKRFYLWRKKMTKRVVSPDPGAHQKLIDSSFSSFNYHSFSTTSRMGSKRWQKQRSKFFKRRNVKPTPKKSPPSAATRKKWKNKSFLQSSKLLVSKRPQIPEIGPETPEDESVVEDDE